MEISWVPIYMCVCVCVCVCACVCVVLSVLMIEKKQFYKFNKFYFINLSEKFIDKQVRASCKKR